MKKIGVFKLSILGLFLSALAACNTVGGGVVIGTHGHGHHGPPAHDHRAIHSYWYYPDNEIYFDASSGVYFYFHESHWYETRKLPHHYRGRLGHRVSIQMETDRPYLHHKEHKKKYHKKKHKKHREKDKNVKPKKGKGRRWDH